jgi:hypothetical protein
MAFRLLVACTDGAIDEMVMPDPCGSMGYCAMRVLNKLARRGTTPEPTRWGTGCA